MSKQISDSQLHAQLEQLSKEVMPERDLWTGIEYAIEHQSQRQSGQTNCVNARDTKHARTHPLLWVASLAIVAVTTWFMYMPTSNAPSIAPSAHVAELSPVEALENDYLLQRDAMLVSFGQPDLQSLPANIQSQFNELNQARASLVAALEADPDNVNLLNLLRWTQKQELQLLEQLYSPQWLAI